VATWLNLPQPAFDALDKQRVSHRPNNTGEIK